MYAIDSENESMVTTKEDLHKIGIYSVEPPDKETLRGRKRQKRIESQTIPKVNRVRKRVAICILCKQQGHYWKTCPRSNTAPVVL